MQDILVTNRDNYLEKYVIDSHKLLWLGGPPTSLHWLAHCLDEQQVPVDSMFELTVSEVVQQGLQVSTLYFTLLRAFLFTSGLE